MSKIETCACPESEHLRGALRRIDRLSTTHTGQGAIDDLAEIAGIVEAAERLEPLPRPQIDRGEPTREERVIELSRRLGRAFVEAVGPEATDLLLRAEHVLCAAAGPSALDAYLEGVGRGVAEATRANLAQLELSIVQLETAVGSTP